MSRHALFATLVTLVTVTVSTNAANFNDYTEQGSFTAPASPTLIDNLPDGRLIILSVADLYIEDAFNTRSFTFAGTLPGADISIFGGSFLKVSPDGTRIAVGNGGGTSFTNFQVGVFNLSDFMGQWFTASHFLGQWFDNSNIALTAGTFGQPAVVTILDITSPNASIPINPTIINGIGGASAGIAIDNTGNLYTGNGFDDFNPVTTSTTGTIKAFTNTDWMLAWTTGTPLDFELEGIEIATILSASPLAFDAMNNLFVGGGNFGVDADNVALVNASAINDVLSGGNPIDALDTTQVRRFDPDTINSNFYFLAHNPITHETYAWDSDTIHIIATDTPSAVPTTNTYAPATMILLMFACAIKTIRSRYRNVASRLVGGAKAKPMFNDRRMSNGITAFILLCATIAPRATAQSPFAATVPDYTPAPGQLVNNPAFNDPTHALGPPTGGGTLNPDNSGIVTLGGFGGYIVLAFDHTVEDHPANPLGLDAIVFSNAFHVSGNPNRKWAESAHIEISQDTNQNSQPDDPWYLIPGSHITNPANQFTTQVWDNDFADPTHPPTLPTWYPVIPVSMYETTAYRLPADPFNDIVLSNPNGPVATEEAIFGYADNTPTLVLGDLNVDNIVDDHNITPEEFYTVPDDPFTVGIRAGSGGGDAFDIAWAIDPNTNQPANLPGFDFIRITTAVNHIDPAFGEQSTDIDAVSDVTPGLMGDADADNDVDLDDFNFLRTCLTDPGPNFAPRCRVMDFNFNHQIDLTDYADLQIAFTGDLSE